MKKFLSTVLALVMVLTTFAMLVPNALAATEKQVEAKVLYEENFDDLNGKTPAEILAGANMKDENVETGDLNEMYVSNGKLRFAYPSEQNAFFILKDNDALTNGYIVEYDVEFLGKFASTSVGDGISFLTGESKGYSTNQGRCGWTSQLRWNRYAFSTVNDNGWESTAMEIPTSISGYSTDMQNKHTAVKAVFDINNKTVQTFVQPYKATLDAWDAETMAYTYVSTGEHSADLFGNDLRLIVYGGIEVAIDNLKVTSLDGTQVIYDENFNDIEAIANDAILSEINWISHQRAAGDAYVKSADGRLILGRSTNVTTAAQQELILLENCEDAKNGFVVEYDFELPYGTNGGEGFGFHSAKAIGSSSNPSRIGWVSQFRWNRQVLSGANDGTGWKGINCNATYNESHMGALTANGSNLQGSHLAVRAVFDPAAGTVTTYAKRYTGEALTWTEADAVQKSQDISAYTNLLDGTVRLVVYATISLRIDNIKITALEKTPNVYGYQASTTNAANIRLLGVIDNDIFTQAEKVGFRVTMTKAGDVTATKDIDCEYVYSSITQWGADTPTQAADMLFGASHIYALHVNGIDEAVTIEVTPYYVDEGVTYFGDAATIEYDPAA